MKRIENNDFKKSQMYIIAKYSGLAFEMLGIISLGTFVGYKLDENSKTEFPIWTIVLSLLSICIALYFVVKKLISK